jgi:hypothetical protein
MDNPALSLLLSRCDGARPFLFFQLPALVNNTSTARVVSLSDRRRASATCSRVFCGNMARSSSICCAVGPARALAGVVPANASRYSRSPPGACLVRARRNVGSSSSRDVRFDGRGARGLPESGDRKDESNRRESGERRYEERGRTEVR